MKKVIVLVIISTCLLISCSYNSSKSYREKRKGYTELKVFMYVYKTGEIDKDSKLLIRQDTYDREGNVVIRTVKPGEDDVYVKKYEYKYNNANMVVEANSYDDNYHKHEIINYYKDNITIAEKIIEVKVGHRFLLKAIYKYDDKGKEISSIHYEDDVWTKESNTTNTYNDKNQIVKEEIYTNDLRNKKVNTTIIIYEYDENGNIILEKDRKGHIINSYKYNDKGLLVESPSFNLTTVFEELGYIESWNNDKVTNSISNYKYDGKGFLIEQNVIGTTNRLTFRYSYSNKNLVKEMTICDKNEKPFTTYIYEYK